MPATTPSISHCCFGLGRVAEEQRVHHGDRPGAHGEDVAEDAAHPGGRALVGLDGRRVVVGLDADGHGDAVADVDDPGVLARADQHVGALGGQPPQVDPRRLVGAVLAPHHGEQGQLEVVGRPAQDGLDLVPLVVGQPERPVQRHPRVGHQVGLLVSARVHGPQVTWPPPVVPMPGAARHRRPAGAPVPGPGNGSGCGPDLPLCDGAGGRWSAGHRRCHSRVNRIPRIALLGCDGMPRGRVAPCRRHHQNGIGSCRPLSASRPARC